MTQPNHDQAGDELAAAYEDFDAFWSTHRAADREQVKIRGQLVPVPVDVPLSLAMRIDRANVADEDEVRDLVGELYGPNVLDAWVSDGMGANELAVVLAWSSVRGSGQRITFAEAAVMVEDALSGKAPAPANREQRRAAARAQTPTSSGGTGVRSSQTSGGNTRSRRRRSRR